MGTEEVVDTLDALKAKAATDGKSDIKLTEEETKRFKTAMADPEFMKMLRDYMEEMQDPAIRAEQETYISELERQDCVPKGKEAVHPKPGFVIKTWFSRDGAGGDAAEKMFINVVTSPKIGQPHRSACTQEGKEGGMWSLPHAVGPMRMESDNAGGHTTTFDVCFHPEALMWSERAKGFRQLVVTVSMDAVQRGYLSTSGHEIRVGQRYRILSGVKYKHGACATMLISVGGTGSQGDGNGGSRDGGDAPRSNETAGASPTSHARSKTTEPTKRPKVLGGRSRVDEKKLQGKELQDGSDEKEGTKAASCPLKSAANGRARSGRSGVPESSASGVEEVPLTKEGGGGVSCSSSPPAPQQRSLPPLEPGETRGRAGTVFSLLESEKFEIADHTADRVRPVAAPQKLLLRVKLPPDAVPTRKLEVLVKPRRVTIGVAGDPEEHPPRFLDLELPYTVEDDSKCSARRDKRGLLVITMPVKPLAVSSLPPTPGPGTEAPCSRPDSKELVDREGRGVPEVESVVADSRDAKEHSCRVAPSKQSRGVRDHSRWVEKAAPGEKFEWRTAGLDCAGVTSSPKDSAETASRDSEAKGSEDGHDADECGTGGEAMEERAARFEPYIACRRFAGAIAGYHYKMGREGLGYYLESCPLASPVEWNETQKAMVGIVEVPDVIPHTVKLSVDGGVMRLAFSASSDKTGRQGREGDRVERSYYDEMELPGGVDGPKCNFEVADANLVIRLVKEPMADWNSLPGVTSKELKARELRAVIVGADRSQPEGENMGVPARPGDGSDRREPGGEDASRASRAPRAPGHGSAGFEDGRGRVKGALNPGLASLAYELD